MFTTIEKLITIRNLRPRKKEGFLKVISIFSFLGIMLGVAILIIVMSVMNGFRSELTQKILGFNSHITIKPYSANINDQFYYDLQNKYKDAKIIKTYNGEAIILIKNIAKGILIRGIDREEAVARHEIYMNLNSLLTKTNSLLKYGGALVMAYPPLRLKEVQETLCSHKLFPSRLRFIHGSHEADARIFLIESVKSRQVECAIEPPLFVYNKDGSYSKEMEKIYASFN